MKVFPFFFLKGDRDDMYRWIMKKRKDRTKISFVVTPFFLENLLYQSDLGVILKINLIGCIKNVQSTYLPKDIRRIINPRLPAL